MGCDPVDGQGKLSMAMGGKSSDRLPPFDGRDRSCGFFHQEFKMLMKTGRV